MVVRPPKRKRAGMGAGVDADDPDDAPVCPDGAPSSDGEPPDDHVPPDLDTGVDDGPVLREYRAEIADLVDHDGVFSNSRYGRALRM